MTQRLITTSTVVCFIFSTSDVANGLGMRCKPRFSSRSYPRRFQPTRITMYLEGIDAISSSSFLVGGSLPAEPNIFSTTSQHIASDPQLEAELLNDVSHLALDFTTFFSPNTAWLRLCNVLGRILMISSDYVPDHYISPDEGCFQAFMLAISAHNLLKSTWPVISAASSRLPVSVRDRRAFALLFSEIDMTFLQFKTLLSSQTLEWLTLEHKEQVELNGDYLYFLYSGDVSTPFHDFHESNGRSKLKISQRTFGEVHFAETLQAHLYRDNKRKTKPEKIKSSDEILATVNATLAAGANGAILLRVSTAKLLKLMSHDAQLSDSMNRLVLMCMQDKLAQTFKTGKLMDSNVYQSN